MNPIIIFYDDVISGKIAFWACEHHNSTKSYSILMKLNRIVPWWVWMNPIKFYDDIISDVISGDIALWACEHDNLTIFHPISTALGMVDGIWVQTNPIEKRLFIYFVFQ